MAGEDLLTYTGQASIAYQDALNQARNAQNALLRQYGFVAPATDGDYSVEAAQGAFDPNTLFDKATGGIDKAKLASLSSTLRAGSTGLLGDINRGGASAEAEAMLGARTSGIGKGGLAAQRAQLAEAQTSGKLGAATNEFMAGIAGALSPIGGAYQNLQNAGIYDKAAIEEANAYKASLSSPIDLTQAPVAPVAPTPVEPGKYGTKGTPGGKPPVNPRGGAIYNGPGGVSWQYRMNGPNGKGWYK